MIFPSKNVDSKKEDSSCWKDAAVSAMGKQSCTLSHSIKGIIQKNIY